MYTWCKKHLSHNTHPNIIYTDTFMYLKYCISCTFLLGPCRNVVPCQTDVDILHNHVCLFWSSLNPSSIFHTEFKQAWAWRFLTRSQTLLEEVLADEGWALLGNNRVQCAVKQWLFCLHLIVPTDPFTFHVSLI